MSTPRILVVEDEPAIREMIAYTLVHENFEVQEAETASDAHQLITEETPDLILLDWMLPGESGLEYARRLRRDDYTSGIPIIMLTARAEENDKVNGLNSGADDYVTKPFSPRELVARIKALIRRSTPLADDSVMQSGDLRLDPASHRVTINKEEIEMGPTEFRLLHFFMSTPDRVFSRGQLLDRVWGTNSFVEERTVDVHILRLRKALNQHGYDRYIQTVRGAGYRFSARG